MGESLEMDDWGGPYVAAAFFCENALQEGDGVLSAIRIIDRFTMPGPLPTNFPSLPPKLVKLVIAFKSGAARGSQKISIGIEAPNGFNSIVGEINALFEGEDRGVNIVLDFVVPSDEGLYWFSVSTPQMLMTRIPLRVIHQTIVFPPGAPNESSD